MAAPQDAGSIYSEVRIRLDKLSNDIKAVNTKFDQLGKNIQTQSNNTAKVTSKNFDAFKLAGVAAIGAVTLAFKASISTFARTEQSLANVRAVSGATAAEFDILSQAAADAGATTRFTASQAADALYFLASAGLDATQSVEALNGVLELAGATGSDLSQSAQTVTATLSQFGLEASKASDIANVFAAAASNSQATLPRLQNALRQVGSVAGSFGISLEETTASLQALYNAGFEGETAGRGLKSALADLGNESSIANKKLAELGIAFNDVNPEVVGLTGAIGNLEKANLSTAQVLDIFGKVAGPQLVALLKTGESGLIEYEKAVTGTNAAAEQYAIQNDTLAGSFDKFKSAAEGAGNVLIKSLAPIFRGILDVVSTLLNAFTKLPSLITGTGAGAAAAATGFLALQKALSLIGVALGGSLGLVTVIGAATVGLVTLTKKFVDARDRTDELEGATIQLKNTTDEYRELTQKLAGDTSDLTENELALLKSRKELLALDINKQLSDLASEYDKVNRQIERQTRNVEELRGETAALSLISQDREAAEKRLLDLQQRQNANQRLTRQEQEEYSTLLTEIVSSQSRLSRLLQNKNEDLISKESELLGITNERQKSLVSIATAVADGTIGVEIYKGINEELYETIKDLSGQIVIQREEQEKATQSAADQLEIQRENERLESERLEIERRLNEIKARSAGLDALVQQGLLSERESLAEKIKLAEEERDILRERFLSTGELTDAIVQGIKTQEAALVAYYQRAEELDRELARSTAQNQNNNTDNFIENQQKGFGAYQDFLRQRAGLDKEYSNNRQDIIEEDNSSEKTSLQDRLQAWEGYYNRIASFATDLFSVLADLALRNAEIEIEEINKKLEADLSAIDAQTQAKLESLGLQEQTKEEELQAEIDAAQEAGDTELANEKQKELDRLLILNEAEQQKEALEKEAAKKTAQLQYEADLAAWRLEKASALVLASQAILQGYAQLGPIGGSIAAAGTAILTGAQLALIDKNKPEPPSLQTGGIVLPRSGGTLARLAENGSPELALNAGAEGQELLGQFAQQISDKMGGKGANIILNIDGITLAKYLADIYYSSGVVTIDGRAIR